MKKILTTILQETGAIAGAASAVYGIYRIYEPAAFIVGGVFLFWYCLPKGKAK